MHFTYLLAFSVALMGSLNSFSAETSLCTEAMIPTLQIQDQDGLGTCYANQAALLIQNATKSEQPVSYQQVSMAYSSLARTPDADITTNSNLVTEGGHGCQAFRAAKEMGYCKNDTMNSFDYHGSEDPLNTQELILESLGDFVDKNAESMDHFTDKQWDKVKEHLEGLIAVRNKQCQTDNFTQDVFARRIGEEMMENYQIVQSLEWGKPIPSKISITTKADMARWKQRYQTYKEKFLSCNDSSDGLNNLSSCSLNVTTMNKLTKYATDKKTTLAGAYQIFMKDFQKDFVNPWSDRPFMHKIYTAANLEKIEKSGEVVKATCNQRLNISDMLRYTDLSKVVDQPTCQISHDHTPENVVQISKLAQDLVDALRKKDLKSNPIPLKKRLATLLRLIAPACEEQMKQGKETLKNLKCTRYAMNFSLFDIPNSFTNGNNNTVYLSKSSEKETISAANQEIHKALCSGTAVGVDVCTGFLSHETPILTNFCKKSIPDVKQSGHAMTIVGMRPTPAGHSEYLVQNSWGKDCRFESPENLSPDKTKKPITCEKDESGRLTGRFWVHSNLLLSNTLNLNIVGKE